MTSPNSPENRLDLVMRLLGWLVVGLLPLYAWSVVEAPTDSVQGVMQKILYVHPPLAYGAYLGFVATAIAGALFLWRGREVRSVLDEKGPKSAGDARGGDEAGPERVFDHDA